MDLTTGETKKSDYEITQEQVEASAEILANILLDYVRSGGNILSLERVFGKQGEENE